MQEIKNTENMEVAITKKGNIKMFTTDYFNFQRWFYYMLLSLTNYYHIYMEIETSAKNIVNPLYVRITNKKHFKKFIEYFYCSHSSEEGRAKIVLSNYDREEVEKSISFSYSNKATNYKMCISINFEDLTFLLKKIAELSLSSKIAYVKFKYCFLDSTTEDVFFSEYDSEKINDYIIKDNKYNDIKNIDNIYIKVGHVKRKNFQNNYFTLYFN